MIGYLTRRLATMLALLFGVSVLVFWLFALMPGDHFSGNRSLTPQRVAELRALYGLDQPVVVRYGIWLRNLFRGDLGYSLEYNRPVAEVLAPLLWNSFLVAFAAFVLTWLIALVTGVLAATRQYSWFDRLVTVALFASLSVPSFFLGLMMIKILAIDLQLFPAGGMLDTGSLTSGPARVVEIVHHLALPVAILTFLGAGSLTRYFRSGMLEVLRADFIRTARAKGLGERAVVFSHALRNALLPAITLLAFELPALFSGAIITEQIFNWPGVGRLQIESVQTRDYDVLMTLTMLLALLTVVGSFLADVLYAVADPRIRLVAKVRHG
ncbi:ABC transporter permease [Naumannella cuiyingiana]|uniref:Peptide/nickel transport system permease protein n=1 Tax=Naumannella cuiyingiana TaxID=1347891 RepID=A0A7Z0IMC5_9ACTN|nr:ABC transporter permease [Naumannella cuiyingiana]NYI72589.1 peptide/nickel transport system permease protein [Naumannella cuiyingiana]